MNRSVIAAIALIVPDYDQGIAFYRDVMGFRLIEDLDQGRKRWITMEPPGGGARLIIAQADGDRQAAAIGN